MYETFPPDMMASIEKFFATEHTREPGRDVYDEVFTTEWFFPLQRKRELAAMMRIARSISPRVVYEIGTDKGSSLYHWCKCLPTVKGVIGCEVRGVPFSDIFERVFPTIDFLWLQESSYASPAVAKVKAWLGDGKIDCLFVDGDKSAFDKDFDTYLPFMNPNGIVFMHDVVDPPMSNVFQAIKKRGYRTEHIRDISETHESLAREAAGHQPVHPHDAWLRHWRGKSCSVGVIYLAK